MLDIWRDKKNYLPFFGLRYFGIFSVQYFLYLCVEYSNAATATILQFISPVLYPFTIAWFIKNERQKRYFLCFDFAMMGVLPDGDKGDLFSYP